MNSKNTWRDWKRRVKNMTIDEGVPLTVGEVKLVDEFVKNASNIFKPEQNLFTKKQVLYLMNEYKKYR